MGTNQYDTDYDPNADVPTERKVTTDRRAALLATFLPQMPVMVVKHLQHPNIEDLSYDEVIADCLRIINKCIDAVIESEKEKP